MKIEKAKLKDMHKIWEIYFSSSIDEVHTQYPSVPAKEIMRRMNLKKSKIVKAFKKSIGSKYGYLIVVLEEKEIIAFGEAGINKMFNDEGTVKKVYVKKEFRKKGIAKKILEELFKWFKQNKIKRIFSDLYVKNIPSKKLHEKFGFHINAISMEKKTK